MKRISTLLAAGAVVSAGLLVPATASAQGSMDSAYWCDDTEFSLGCYTDGTPKVPGLNFWEARDRAEAIAAAEAAAEEAENPTPSFFDNIATIFGWFSTGSAGSSADDEETQAPDEEAPALEVADPAAE
ncbi:hypothetical protein [Rhodococcus gannanensis]|uniref:Uncharacterized protein n=1 Tax=Rhodococcus gannanensis TaxID=1960308 RepID=A0ABW4P2K9_9NOCA